MSVVSGLLREGLKVQSDTAYCTLARRMLSCPQHEKEIKASPGKRVKETAKLFKAV